MADLKLIKPQGVQNIINKFCVTIGMIPTSYKLSLTYEEQILAIGHYLEETVIPALNNNAEAVGELQALFVQLKDYVENYFDNLDIQNEINNKLDEMAEDGTLTEILANYLNLTRFIDTTLNLINETSNTKIKNGYIIETLGYNEINDGGNTKILITDTIPQNKFYFTLKNNLYGIPLTNKENVLIYGIKNDGITDNTNLLNNIINYVRKLYFPQGTYLFNNLDIDNKNGFELVGDGYNSILKCNNPNTSSFFYFIKMSNGKNYKCHNLKIDGNYVGSNFAFSFINVNNSIIEKCLITGATSQRTLNLQNFDSNYGYNNIIRNNYVLKDNQTCNSGALIECTGELSGDMNQFLHNTKIINNTCICKCIEYIGDNGLFDCIETDNCYDTLIDGNYCETTMHHGISLDTRNAKTICSNNHLISKSTLSSGARNGIEITGSYGAELMEGIVSNNIIDGFRSNGISVNAINYSIIGNKINNANRGIILLELCTSGNMICENICTNITEFGIYVSGPVAKARILNNNAKIYLGDGTGSQNYIVSPVTANDLTNGMPRIEYINGLFNTDYTQGIQSNGLALNMLSDGRLVVYNRYTKTWQSISKSNI